MVLYTRIDGMTLDSKAYERAIMQDLSLARAFGIRIQRDWLHRAYQTSLACVLRGIE